MTQKLVWRHQALDEFEEATAWYESHSIFAASRLLENTKSRLAQILENPKRFSYSNTGYRWVAVAKFPYQIHYAESGDNIVILAFWHEKKDRQPLFKRLSEE